LKEVTVNASHEVLMEVDDNTSLIVGDPQGILDQHLSPHLILLLNNIIILKDIKLNIDYFI
jgi:hypothetical protein